MFRVVATLDAINCRSKDCLFYLRLIPVDLCLCFIVSTILISPDLCVIRLRIARPRFFFFLSSFLPTRSIALLHCSTRSCFTLAFLAKRSKIPRCKGLLAIAFCWFGRWNELLGVLRRSLRPNLPSRPTAPSVSVKYVVQSTWHGTELLGVLVVSLSATSMQCPVLNRHSMGTSKSSYCMSLRLLSRLSNNSDPDNANRSVGTVLFLSTLRSLTLLFDSSGW